MAKNMHIDLGGIAKGYIADAALKKLRALNINSALIDAGGDIVVTDAPPGKDAWRIAVADLHSGRIPQKSPRVLHLKNQAAATSGDVYQFVEIDGQRYSHIIHPKTGLGLKHRSSVTVIASSGMAADAMASAVSVMGSQRGLRLVEETNNTEAFVVEIHGKETVRAESSGFSKLVSQR